MINTKEEKYQTFLKYLEKDFNEFIHGKIDEKNELSIENCLGEYQIFDIDYLIGSTEEHITIMNSYNRVYKNSLNGLSSSIWNYSTSINNGYPYLKNLYW